MKKIFHFARFLLFPFAILYTFIVLIRNKMFDWGLLKSRSFDTPLIGVGNIRIGGTGKTPMSEYLIEFLSDNFQVAFISRGYKRKTKGFVFSSTNTPPHEIGDEAYQIKKKFKEISVAVDENRPHGIEQLLKTKPETDVVILDDCFQHRYVKPGINILLTEYGKPLFRDYPLPMGDLREYRNAKNRADFIIVTKCPFFTLVEKELAIRNLRPKPEQKVFFTTTEYEKTRPLWDEAIANDEVQDVLMLTGIANPEPMFEYLCQKYNSVTKVNFPDHYDYRYSDLVKVENIFKNIAGDSKVIVTTEKDVVKLGQMKKVPDEIKRNTFVLPIRFKFLFNDDIVFKKEIFRYVRKD